MGVIVSHFNLVLHGLLLTIALSAVSICGASIVGLIVGIMRVSPVGAFERVAVTYIEVLRSTPIPVILVFIFFALPDVKITLSPFASAACGLSAYMAAYVAEAVRSGVNSVDPGHIEAARAIGLKQRHVLRFVVIPEALRAVIPTLGNLFVDLVKDTSIAYTISVMEITGTATTLITKFAEPVRLFLVAAVCYLVLTIPLGAVVRRIEKALTIAR
ncbi:MAG: amino acid ABC transporter permease [Acetobacteraceae bacterium]